MTTFNTSQQRSRILLYPLEQGYLGRPFMLRLFLFLEERLNADRADDGNVVKVVLGDFSIKRGLKEKWK